MRFNALQDWLRWLESCHPTEIELGLDRLTQVASQMDFNFHGAKVITVAGTNGKGSCVALLDSLLSASGYRTATYTSPHLLAYNERIKLQGIPVTDRDIIEAFGRVDCARANTSLTYFEFGTLAALDIFSRQQLDVIILEVGLGGRLDAVNIIDPDIAVISSIAIDHQEWLGNDREQIGWEKAGIMRSGKPVVCGDPSPPGSIQQTADQKGARLYQRDRDFAVHGLSAGGWRWQGLALDNTSRVLDNLPAPELSIDNAATVLQTLELLALPLDDSIYASLATVSLAGRFQQLEYDGHQLILDVAHNPAAANKLAERLEDNARSGKVYMLVALMHDKDCKGFVRAMSSLVDCWCAVDLPEVPRAMPGAELAGHILDVSGQQARLYSNPKQGLGAALAMMTDADVLVVAGSFFLVSEIMIIINSGEGA